MLLLLACSVLLVCVGLGQVTGEHVEVPEAGQYIPGSAVPIQCPYNVPVHIQCPGVHMYTVTQAPFWRLVPHENTMPAHKNTDMYTVLV